MKPDLFDQPLDPFVPRHLGSSARQIAEMLEFMALDSIDTLVEAVIPGAIRLQRDLDLPAAEGEHQRLRGLREVAQKNKIWRSYLGLGYHDTVTPAVILRNVLENPGWYTQYTPYQAEISQGRLEALVNFQTMVSELTALPIANASLLDEATAAAEAMTMCWAAGRRKKATFVVDSACHPQTLGVVATRARPIGLTVQVVDLATAGPEALEGSDIFGALVQYPTSDGEVRDFSAEAEVLHSNGAFLTVAADPLALVLLRPPGDFGADVAVGSTQRFGVPLGSGGPHAGYLACRKSLERLIPGRIAGLSKDIHGHPAYRLALQTREQHIRREKATSNICTAQVLPAILASMYAVYHGPDGLRRIAMRVHQATRVLAEAVTKMGAPPTHAAFFDTLSIELDPARAKAVQAAAAGRQINLRDFAAANPSNQATGADLRTGVAVTLDETVEPPDLLDLVEIFAEALEVSPAGDLEDLAVLGSGPHQGLGKFARTGNFLEQGVFSRFHSEHEMLRYLHRLQTRDLSLTHSMIPLGSCTMKLNATAEMIPITWPEFGRVHPYAPNEQQRGYEQVAADLENWLAEITGLPAVSLQPNAGSQGEYAGLLTIRARHENLGQAHRNICLIPTSAHGTNPASAVMAGLKVVAVACDDQGNIDLADLESKAALHSENLAALMITYPSTHGVFEEAVAEACMIIHQNGGLVYLDGANMNAQVGLCRPGDFGADVCHLNLHKTFCIPHGGGGPGMGPICVTRELEPFLPSDPLTPTGDAGVRAVGPVSPTRFGSAGILPISWMYIALMGASGLKRASQLAILNANYMAKRLGDHYPVLYVGEQGFVAHEFIIDLRDFKKTAGVTVDDVAKRLMDYGFHAPTMSWPVAGTMMIEPTESESKTELDRFCEAMIAIRAEIRDIEQGNATHEDNLLKSAPHTARAVANDNWPHAYSRESAAFPAPWVRDHKFWPPVGRVDNAFGDRNLVCTCDPVETWDEG